MKAGTEFSRTLLDAARTTPIEHSRLIAAIIEGTAPRAALGSYARIIASMAVSFPRNIAAVLSICGDDDVRTSLLSNLLEEEGVVSFSPSTGLVRMRDRIHGAMARKFASAAGVAADEVVAMPPAAWFAAAIDGGDWLGAFSFFSVGLEANVPRTFRLIVNPLMQHYGFTADQLEFLTEHFVADERHGVEAAELIARIASTPEERDRALTGARRGGIVWRALHRTLGNEAA